MMNKDLQTENTLVCVKGKKLVHLNCQLKAKEKCQFCCMPDKVFQTGGHFGKQSPSQVATPEVTREWQGGWQQTDRET